MPANRARRDERGISLIEILTALTIFSLAVLGLTSAGVLASKQLRIARTQMKVWTAAHSQMERLIAQGYDAVTNGSAIVEGQRVEWTAQGTDPRKIILVVWSQNTRGGAVADTFVTYLADPRR